MAENNKSTFDYDEDESVKYIKTHLPESMKDSFSDDDINYVVDLVYDFYDEKGYLDEDNEDEYVDIDEDELISYITANIKKDADARKYTEEEISAIVEGEIAYCDSINLYE